MKDPRAIIAGTLAGIALVGGIVLAGLERDPVQIATAFGIATTFGGYAMGLYSEPRS